MMMGLALVTECFVSRLRVKILASDPCPSRGAWYWGECFEYPACLFVQVVGKSCLGSENMFYARGGCSRLASFQLTHIRSHLLHMSVCDLLHLLIVCLCGSCARQGNILFAEVQQVCFMHARLHNVNEPRAYVYTEAFWIASKIF